MLFRINYITYYIISNSRFYVAYSMMETSLPTSSLEHVYGSGVPGTKSRISLLQEKNVQDGNGAGQLMVTL